MLILSKLLITGKMLMENTIELLSIFRAPASYASDFSYENPWDIAISVLRGSVFLGFAEIPITAIRYTNS